MVKSSQEKYKRNLYRVITMLPLQNETSKGVVSCFFWKLWSFSDIKTRQFSGQNSVAARVEYHGSRAAIWAILTAAQQMYTISEPPVVFTREDRSRASRNAGKTWIGTSGRRRGWKAANCVRLSHPHSYSRPWRKAKQRGSLPNAVHDIGLSRTTRHVHS